MRSPLLMAALAALLACGVAACNSGGSGPAADGPLSSGLKNGPIPRGDACAPGGGPRTFGDSVFVNYGHTTVVLDRATLQRPRNIRVLAVYAVPGESLIGTALWPLHGPGVPAEWTHRQPVHGFRLAPGKQFTMVWALQAQSARRASARGQLVYYHDSAGSYVAKDDFGMTLERARAGANAPR